MRSAAGRAGLVRGPPDEARCPHRIRGGCVRLATWGARGLCGTDQALCELSAGCRGLCRGFECILVLMARRRAPIERLRNKPLLTVSEAALLLGVDRSSLYRAIRQGTAVDLPMARVGKQIRIPRRAVDRILAAQEDEVAEGRGDATEPSGCPTCGSAVRPTRTRRSCSPGSRPHSPRWSA